MNSPTSVLNFTVPGMSCGHCVAALTEEISKLAGVADVSVDLAAKSVVVTGNALDDSAIREAISEAGYEAVS